MALLERRLRIYVCDRCGDQREAEGNSPAPAGWRTLVRGAVHGVTAEDVERPTLMCVDCSSWLTKFLSGCKVAD